MDYQRFSKGGPWAGSVSITREPVRNADSRAVLTPENHGRVEGSLVGGTGHSGAAGGRPAGDVGVALGELDGGGLPWPCRHPEWLDQPCLVAPHPEAQTEGSSPLGTLEEEQVTRVSRVGQSDKMGVATSTGFLRPLVTQPCQCFDLRKHWSGQTMDPVAGGGCLSPRHQERTLVGGGAPPYYPPEALGPL